MLPINYGELLQYLYPGIDLVDGVVIRDDGAGPYIAEWNLLDPPQPSQAELDAAWTAYVADAPNRAAAEAAKEAAAAKVLTLRQEARQFLIDNPNAKLLIELSGPDLETAIETRSAAGETLLLKTMAFGMRFLYEALKAE